MCLDFRYDPKIEKAMIAKLPDEFVVYKIVKKRLGKYKPACVVSDFYAKGLNEAPTKNFRIDTWSLHHRGVSRQYLPYYHCFRTKQGARQWGKILLRDKEKCVVKLKIPKKSIRAIGTQRGCYSKKDYQVIVSKKIIMPSPTDKKAVVN